MNNLTNLLKDHQIGTWCKRAAWIILAIGLLEIALNIYNVSRQFGYGSSFVNVTPGLVAQLVGYGITYFPSILFYFFILYAAGALVNHFVTDSEVYDEDEDNDEVEEDEEIAPGQMR